MINGPVSRRRFLHLGGALATGGALAAHVHAEALASAPTDIPTLTFMTNGGSARFCAQLNVIAHNFTKLHPTIRLAPIPCGTGTQDFRTVLLARIAAGNPPDAALVWDPPVTFAVRGALEPIDHLMAMSVTARQSNCSPAELASCQYAGRIWGIPLSFAPYAIWYNADWFAKKGISTKREDFPKTFDGLHKLSKEFTSWKNGKLVSAGMIPLSSPGDWVATLFIWSALNGGQIFDAQHLKYTIDSDANVALMEYMLSWLNDEYNGDWLALQKAGNWTGYVDEKGRPAAFQNGQLAMLVQGAWFLGDIYSAPLKFEHYDAAAFPVGPGGKKTVSGYWPEWLTIPKGSPHQQEAFAWLDYLSSTGFPALFSVTPELPANKTVKGLIPTVTIQKRGRAFARDIVRFFHQQQDICIPMWNSPIQAFAGDQLTKAVTRILSKAAKPRDALAEAQKACQNQLEQVVH